VFATLADAQPAEVLPVLPPPVAITTIPGQLHNARAIASFLQQLPPGAGQTLTIVQIGDSHTAGDMLTNGWRRRWQAEYGAGGRGMMTVGRPYQGYLAWGATAHQSPEWQTRALFGRQHTADGPALGLSGFTLTAAHAGAMVQLTADAPGFMFDRFALCGLTGPVAGAVELRMGAVTRTANFTAPEPGAACFDIATPDLAGVVSVTTLDDRPVSLTSWESRRAGGGIILANMGVVGSRFLHFTRNNDAVLAVELKQAHPDLLVIAFGTNEGFDPSLKLDEAEATTREQIGRIRRLLGYRVPILLLGPPDTASNRPEVVLPSHPETTRCGGGWSVPGNLALIRQLQLRLAQDMDLAFWDWQQAMGGPCASSRWVAQGLQRGDHVHFTAEGGRRLGEVLAANLDHARADLAK
jgi:lysophospholipase L1-like esterase